MGTKYSDDGMKHTHLLSLGGSRLKRSLELAVLGVKTVGLHGCASIVHVEGTVTRSTVAVTLRVSAEMVITVSTGSLRMWLVARSRVGREHAAEEINDAETHCELQLGAPCVTKRRRSGN